MRLVWDNVGERYYETGVKRGVLYPVVGGAYPKGVVWNGLTAVTESPSGAEASPIYADDIKYVELRSAEEFGATIEAYTYPDEFAICDGSASIAPGVIVGQQPRKPFGLSYRTIIGNDVDMDEHGYKLHLIYNAMASPSERGYQTVNDSPEAITFSWEMTTTPIAVGEGFKPTACITIDSRKVDKDKLAALEDVLYGTADTDARLPLPAEVIEIMGDAVEYSISLDKTTASVAVGSNVTLKATTEPSTETVTWTSSNEEVATVDSNGKVTGVAAGTANVSAFFTENGMNYTATCAVTVTGE